VRLEDVVVIAADSHFSLCIKKDVHLSVLHVVEGAYIVQAPHMVAVGMSNEDGIEMVNMVV
jgi:hypothetical protein